MASKKIYDIAFKIAAKLDKQYGDTFNKAENIASKTLSKIGSIAKAGAVAIGAAITATAVAVGVAVNGINDCVNVYAGFEDSMMQVAATMGMSAEEIANGSEAYQLLEKSAKDAGANTRFSASEAADALNYLALAGYDAAQASEALPTILNLAAAGGLDLAYASDLATDAMGALGIVANEQNLTAFGDSLAKASQKSNTSIQQLGEAILTVGGTAQNLAGGTTELNTALGVLANVGIKGAQGGTALRNMILAMTPTTDKAVAAFERLNVESYDAEGNLRPLNETFKDLNASLSTMTSKEKTEALNSIFNKVDLKAASAMLAACASSIEELGTAFLAAGVPAEQLNSFLQNFDDAVYNTMTETEFLSSVMKDFGVDAEEAGDIYTAFAAQLNGISYENLYNEIAECDGAMQLMADTMESGLAGSERSFASAVEGMQIEIGSLFAAFKQGLLDDSTQIVRDFTENLQAANGDWSKIGDAVGSLLQDVVNMVADKLPQIVEMGIKIISSLGNALIDNLPIIMDAASDIVLALLSGVIAALPGLTDGALLLVLALVEGIFSHLPSLLEAAIQMVVTLTVGISDALPRLIPAMVQAVIMMVKALIDNLPMILDAALQLVLGLAEGIKDALPELIKAIPILIGHLVSAIIAMLPDIIVVGIEIIFALVYGLIAATPELIDAVPNLIIAIVFAIIENLDKIILAAPEIIMALITGLIGAIPELVLAIPQIIVSIVDTFCSYDWASIGKSIIEGLINGVLGMAGKAVDAVKNVGGKIADGFKGLFGGGSSATVSEKVTVNSSRVPMYASGGINTPDTFIAGENGAELITGAKGSTVFNAVETGSIFNNLSLLPDMVAGKLSGAFGNLFKSPENISRYDNLGDQEAPPESLPGSSSEDGYRCAPIEILYAPNIQIDGSGQDEASLRRLIEELLQQHSQDIEQIVRDVIYSINRRKERLSNA